MNIEKPHASPLLLTFIAVVSSLLLTACTTTSTPDYTPEGLVRVEKTKADRVYARPGTDLSGYTKVVIIEPHIAFRKGWQSDTNADRMLDRVTDEDMAEMIAMGKEMLSEEFAKELEKGGYELATKGGPDVLSVAASIVNLDIFAPDPDNMRDAWTKTYTNGSGYATLFLELYDSVSAELLVQAYDSKTNEDDGFAWRIPRSQMTNIQDARAAIRSWAQMLVRGLDKAKTMEFPAAPGPMQPSSN